MRKMSNKYTPNAPNTLFTCLPGKVYKIAGCNLDAETKNRLYEMGLTPNTAVKVVKRAPLNDPLQISVRGYSLCVRGSIAKQFEVEELS